MRLEFNSQFVKDIIVAVDMYFWCTCMHTGVYALMNNIGYKCIYTSVNGGARGGGGGGRMTH